MTAYNDCFYILCIICNFKLKTRQVYHVLGNVKVLGHGKIYFEGKGPPFVEQLNLVLEIPTLGQFFSEFLVSILTVSPLTI